METVNVRTMELMMQEKEEIRFLENARPHPNPLPQEREKMGVRTVQELRS
jgi:hypothetical protein